MFQNRKRSFGSWISKSTAIVSLFILFFANTLFADRIIGCNDGDTCQAQRGKKISKIRLFGIDAPESDQEGAESSRNFLESLVKGKDVLLKCAGENQGRRVCSINIGNTDIQKEMVRSGWAFDYPKYSLNKYSADQKAAKEAHKGLWTIKKLISPYCYRYTGIKECNENKLYQP